MDLGYPYTKQEIKDRAARFKQLSSDLMRAKSVPDVKYQLVFIVERIFFQRTKMVKGLKQYLVKWEHYDEPTWQFEFALLEDLSEEVFKNLLCYK